MQVPAGPAAAHAPSPDQGRGSAAPCRPSRRRPARAAAPRTGCRPRAPAPRRTRTPRTGRPRSGRASGSGRRVAHVRPVPTWDPAIEQLEQLSRKRVAFGSHHDSRPPHACLGTLAAATARHQRKQHPLLPVGAARRGRAWSRSMWSTPRRSRLPSTAFWMCAGVTRVSPSFLRYLLPYPATCRTAPW